MAFGKAAMGCLRAVSNWGRAAQVWWALVKVIFKVFIMNRIVHLLLGGKVSMLLVWSQNILKGAKTPHFT